MAAKPEIEKCCAYCEFASGLLTSERMLCEKHGAVAPDHRCGSFSYDPLKRVPRVQKPPKLDYVNVDDL